MIDNVINLMVGLGVVLIVTGVALVSVPAALIVWGAALIALAVMIARTDEHRKRTDRR